MWYQNVDKHNRGEEIKDKEVDAETAAMDTCQYMPLHDHMPIVDNLRNQLS